ncbi:MAG: homoserine dehydrogenase [Clostridiaceae bacterium]|nr:homoserine dehydrogenase [Clostridiaceae bacterium]
MINIAIMGYGVVGSGVAEVCRMNADAIEKKAGQGINIKKILDLRDFPDDPFGDRVTHRAEDIFEDPDIAIVVETIGGTGIALELSRRALEAGKHVVTSNKELVAAHGPELMALAQAKSISYMYEASVGGGIPIVRPLHKCLSANVIQLVAGILNGTTNYILTRMDAAGIRFEQALSEAQEHGYAEQNPTADLDGLDACRKLAILGSITLGEYIDSRQVHTEGITSIMPPDLLYAQHLQMKLKLIGRFRLLLDQQADMIVAPMLISRSHPIAVADDVNNAILVEGNALGEALFYGRGAGKLPTASAVVADVIECAMHLGRLPHLITWAVSDRTIVRPHDDCPVQALVRLRDSLPAERVRELFGPYGAEPVQAQDLHEHAWLVGRDAVLSEGQLAARLRLLDADVIGRIRLFV